MSRVDEARIVELAKELVRVPSVSGEEKAVMHRARELLEEIGIEAELHGSEDRPIINAVLNPGAERLLVFNGHLDVVPIAKPDAWTKAPWDPVLIDGMLYGRGASSRPE